MIARTRGSRFRVFRAAACLLLLVDGQLHSAGSGVATEFSQRYPNYWSVGVSGDGAASLEGLKRVYSQLLRTSAVPPKAVVLDGYPDHASAVCYMGSQPPEASFAGTINALKHALAHDPRHMAKLTAIGHDVVAQEVDGSVISRTVLSGEDPTIFSSNGRRFEILNLYFVRLPASIRPDGKNPVIATLQVLADALPAASDAQKAAALIQRRLGGEEQVRISIRTDSWFLDGPPLWYPFAKAQPPPTHQQYVSGGEVYCEGDEAQMRCAPVHFPDR